MINMKVKTASYFDNFKNKNNCYLVQVSNSKPKWFNIDRIFKSAIPKWELIDNYKKGIINQIEYSKSYIDYLKKYKNRILKEWQEIKKEAKNKDIILLCWEKDTLNNIKFCHRYLLHSFLHLYDS